MNKTIFVSLISTVYIFSDMPQILSSHLRSMKAHRRTTAINKFNKKSKLPILNWYFDVYLSGKQEWHCRNEQALIINQPKCSYNLIMPLIFFQRLMSCQLNYDLIILFVYDTPLWQQWSLHFSRRFIIGQFNTYYHNHKGIIGLLAILRYLRSTRISCNEIVKLSVEPKFLLQTEFFRKFNVSK